MVGDGGRTQVRLADPLDDLVEEIGVVEQADKIGEIEVFEDLAGVLREGGDVGVEVGLDAGLAERAEVHLRGVEKGEAAGGAQQELFARLLGEILFGELFDLGEHLGLARGEHAFEAAQKRERKNDAAVLALAKVTAQKVGDRPAVGGEVIGGLGHG